MVWYWHFKNWTDYIYCSEYTVRLKISLISSSSIFSNLLFILIDNLKIKIPLLSLTLMVGQSQLQPLAQSLVDLSECQSSLKRVTPHSSGGRAQLLPR